MRQCVGNDFTGVIQQTFAGDSQCTQISRCTFRIAEASADRSGFGRDCCIVLNDRTVGRCQCRGVERRRFVGFGISRAVGKRTACNGQTVEFGSCQIGEQHINVCRSHIQQTVVRERTRILPCAGQIADGKRTPVKQFRVRLSRVAVNCQTRFSVFTKDFAAVFGTVTADVNRAVIGHVLGSEVAVANAQRTVVQSHVVQRTLGGFLRTVRAQSHETVTNDRQIAVNEFEVSDHGLIFTHEDEMTAVGNSHAARDIDHLFKADAVVENICVRDARCGGFFGAADIQSRVSGIGLGCIVERFTDEDRIGRTAFRIGCLDAICRIHVERFAGFTVECNFECAPGRIVCVNCIEFGKNVACNRSRVHRIVKGYRTPPKLNARCHGINHIAHADDNVNARINDVVRVFGVNVVRVRIHVCKDLIERGG